MQVTIMFPHRGLYNPLPNREEKKKLSSLFWHVKFLDHLMFPLWYWSNSHAEASAFDSSGWANWRSMTSSIIFETSFPGLIFNNSQISLPCNSGWSRKAPKRSTSALFKIVSRREVRKDLRGRTGYQSRTLRRCSSKPGRSVDGRWCDSIRQVSSLNLSIASLTFSEYVKDATSASLGQKKTLNSHLFPCLGGDVNHSSDKSLIGKQEKQVLTRR